MPRYAGLETCVGRSQAELGKRHDVALGSGPIGRGPLEEMEDAEATELGPDGLGGGRYQVARLTEGLGPSLRAEDRATRKTRMDSTFPSLVLASRAAVPDSAASAAAMASWGSDFPLSRRRWRLGRSTSATADPLAWRWRVSPAP